MCIYHYFIASMPHGCVPNVSETHETVLLECTTGGSWWNVSFKETRYGDGVADGAVTILLRLWLHAAALLGHAILIRVVT